MDSSGFSRPAHLLLFAALALLCDGRELVVEAGAVAARHWHCPTATLQEDAGLPVPVTSPEDGSGKCAVTQKSIVFLSPVPAWPSSVLRGQLTAAAINHAWGQSLGMSASFCGPDTCDQAIEAHGRPSVCIFTKIHWPEYLQKCRQLGALVLWDLLDLPEITNMTYLREHDADAYVTVTSAHAAYLNAQGLPAIAVPRPHSNLGGWSVAHTSRPRVRGVGFVYEDHLSLPSMKDLALITSSVCAQGAVLYLVRTHNGVFSIEPQKCDVWVADSTAADDGVGRVGCTAETTALAECPGDAASDKAALRRRAAIKEILEAPSLTMPDLPDSFSQRPYYESSELLQLIDVGLVWKPLRAREDPLMVSFRPGTRLAWWWSHGIPTIGFPTHAYLETAIRTGYPAFLMNVTTGPQLSDALCRVSPPAARECLRQQARRSAEIISPQASAHDWLRAICKLSNICRTGASRPRRS